MILRKQCDRVPSVGKVSSRCRSRPGFYSVKMHRLREVSETGKIILRKQCNRVPSVGKVSSRYCPFCLSSILDGLL